MSDPVRGSGKQVLLTILQRLSTRVTADEDLQTASRQMRVGLLAHGSTAEESYYKVARLVWATEKTRAGDVVRQGMATRGGVFLSDVLESVFEIPEVSGHLRSEYALDPGDLEAVEHALWALVSSLQMYSELRPVEVDEPIDIDRWVEYLGSKYDYHFTKQGRESSD